MKQMGMLLSSLRGVFFCFVLFFFFFFKKRKVELTREVLHMKQMEMPLISLRGVFSRKGK